MRWKSMDYGYSPNFYFTTAVKEIRVAGALA
jgi:hypothetical protein